MRTGVVIIAAGNSSHEDKMQPMKKVGSISAVQRLIKTFRQAGVHRIVLVTSQQEHEALEKHVARMGTVCLPNYDADHCQMIDYAKIGLAYLQQKCDQILLTPADIPFFTALTVQQLMQCSAKLASPVCGERAGHPLLVASSLIPFILQYEGENGLRGAIKNCGCARTFIEVEDDGILCDIDSSDDYDQLLKQHNHQILHPSLKLRLVKEKPFFGPGTVQLLTFIQETGSVRLACQHMGISYSKGWKILAVMEEQLGETIVDRQQGGKNGGMAALTPKGKELLDKFRQFEECCRTLVQQAFEQIF